jgi:hypothetical protein
MQHARWCPPVLESSIEDMTPLSLLSFALLLISASTPERYSRVRPEDDASRGIIRDGVRSSPTVARLVETLERSRVIVYVRAVPGLHRRGVMTLLAHTDVVTYLLVRIDPGLTRRDRIAMLAHELTHALEVASAAPPVRTDDDLERLYARIGVPGANTHEFESLAARANETAVRAELARVLLPPPAPEPPHGGQSR